MMNSEIMQIFAAFIGSFGFAILYNIRGKKLAFAALGGFLSWSLFLILEFMIESEPIRYFIVSATTTLYSEIMARVLKTPTTTFITTALIPLIPGGSLYYTMANAFEGNLESFLLNGIVTLKLAMALALGVVVVTALVKLIYTWNNKKNNKRLDKNL